MKNIELKSQIEWYLENGLIPDEWEIIDEQTSENGLISYLKVETQLQPFFMKVFKPDAKKQAETELVNSQLLNLQIGWKTPDQLATAMHSDSYALAYELIRGGTLQERFTNLRNRTDTGLAYEGIDIPLRQTLSLSGAISLDSDQNLVFTPIKRLAILDRLVTQGGTLPKLELEEATESFLSAVAGLRQLVGGYFFDRNPKNVLVDGANYFQIDSEVISPSSALLDVSILMRSGYDPHVRIPTQHFLEAVEDDNLRESLFSELNVFSQKAEFDAVNAVNGKFGNKDLSSDCLETAFTLASVYTHLHYLRYPFDNRVKHGTKYEPKTRHLYQVVGAMSGFQKLHQPDHLARIASITGRSLTSDNLSTLEQALLHVNQFLTS